MRNVLSLEIKTLRRTINRIGIEHVEQETRNNFLTININRISKRYVSKLIMADRRCIDTINSQKLFRNIRYAPLIVN